MFRGIVLAGLLAAITVGAADKDVEKIYQASSSLIFDAEKESVDVLKEGLNTYKQYPHVQDSIARVLGYALLRKRPAEFDKFKEEIASTYPGIDFSFAETQLSSYDEVIKKANNGLILNLTSTNMVVSGESPVAIKVKPKENAVREFKGPGADLLEPVEIPFNVNTTEVIGNNNSQDSIDKTVFDNQPGLPLTDDVIKTKKSDIAKDSIYYKVYHAASKVQKKENEGLKELYSLSFEGEDQELSGAVVKAVTLSMINNKSTALADYAEKVKKKYGEQVLSFLQEEPFQKKCDACNGEGHINNKCRKCLNGGCRNCNGKGEISYRGLNGVQERKTCPTCRGQKQCKACEGSKILKKDCRNCGARGKYLNVSILGAEYDASIQYLVDATPKLANDNGLYIGVGVNKLAMARLQALEMAKLDRERKIMEEQRRIMEQEQKRREAIAQKEKEKKEKENDDYQGTTFVVEATVEGGTNATLDHAVLEVRNFVHAQERRDKSVNKLMEKCEGKFEETRPTLYIHVTGEFANAGKDYREQVADGWYRFWELRASQNGLGKKVVLKIKHNGTTIGLAKDGNVKVK